MKEQSLHSVPGIPTLLGLLVASAATIAMFIFGIRDQSGLLIAGAIIIGKTNTPEFGAGAQTWYSTVQLPVAGTV